MIITQYAPQFVKLTVGSLTIAINPPSKKSEFVQSKSGADIVLLTMNHPDMNGSEQAFMGDKEPFVISGPGEYEVKDMFIRGFPSKSFYGGSERLNTIYTFVMDDIHVCFLGGLAENDLPEETKEAFEQVDLLFVPIGGEGVFDPATAYKFAVKREPSLIIPMHYKGVGEKNALNTFLKEGGAEKVKPVDKLTIKKKDLIGTGNIAVIES